MPDCLEMADRIAEVLKGFSEIRFCTIFGSAAHNRMTADSDVDIAVAGTAKLPTELRLALSKALSSALGRGINLIDLQDESWQVRPQALCTGHLVQNLDKEIYAGLLSRLWFDEADMRHLNRIFNEGSTGEATKHL